MLLGMLPFSAFATDGAEKEASSLQNTYEEKAQVSVAYDSVDRESATVTYRKDGIAADAFNLIFLVDMSTSGAASHEAFERMMYDSGAGYIYNYSASSTVQVITYQSTAVSSPVLSSKTSLMHYFGQHQNPGEGNGNAEAGLEAAIEAVEKAQELNDDQTVVFWVLGDNLGVVNNVTADEDEIRKTIGEKLQTLNGALGENDALITWQLAGEPDELLAQYATQYTPAHETTPVKAAYAKDDATLMSQEMADSLEKIVHDHYHDITFTIQLNQDQEPKLATEITDVAFHSPSSTVVNVESIKIANDGQSATVHVESMCRQVNLEMTVQLALDATKYGSATAINGFTVTDSHIEGGTGGGLHTGIFDEQTVHNLTLTMPAAEVDRTLYTVQFVDKSGNPLPNLETMEFLAGQRVVLPADGVTQDGEEFGGWNRVVRNSDGTLVYDNANYVPGHVFTMPERNILLTPAFGHVEMYLDLGAVTEPIEKDNQLGKEYFDFSYTMPDGTVIDQSKIRTIVFEDKDLYFRAYDSTDGSGNSLGAYGSVPDIPEALVARNMSDTVEDNVIAYVTPVAGVSDQYDLHVAGPGGVKAPADCKNLFEPFNAYGSKSSYILTSIDVAKLDVSEVTNMYGMFFCLSSTCQEIRGLETWDTSKVTNM